MPPFALRCLVCAASAFLLALLRPITVPGLSEAGLVLLNLAVGILLAIAALLLEIRIRRIPALTLVGALAGSLFGTGLALGVVTATGPALDLAPLAISMERLRPAILLLLAGLGAIVGAHQAPMLRAVRPAAAPPATPGPRACKILDTSVIIDGRIADILDAGFLDGPLVVPQFVLRELQHVADSADGLKRNRGRKGLDILQKIKKSQNVEVILSETEFPGIRDVDQKLIELALQIAGKIVTNDLNLNKVAQLRGVGVLNINDLANALKPVLLPGETMKVFILKEGKEANQGVAYLDDGTMVVVDNASRQIGRTVEIIVTSVLQTTAGKMFFGRFASDLERPMARRPAREREGPAQEAG